MKESQRKDVALTIIVKLNIRTKNSWHTDLHPSQSCPSSEKQPCRSTVKAAYYDPHLHLLLGDDL